MKPRVLRSAEFWTGIGLVAIGGICVYGAEQIYRPLVTLDPLGPRGYPLILGVILGVLGTVIVVRAVLVGSPRADPGRMSAFAVILMASIAYMAVFSSLGYLLSTVLFLSFLFNHLGERRHWLTATIAVGTTLVLYVGFTNFLNVGLPKGLIGM